MFNIEMNYKYCIRINKAPLLKLLYMVIVFAIVVKPLYGNNESMEIKNSNAFFSTKIKDLNFNKKSIDNEYKKYLDFYNLYNESLVMYYGIFNSTGFSNFGQIFVPENYKSIVIIIHGYLDHSGNLKNLINKLTKKKFAVAVFDLPGHGLSSGKRADIGNFTQYVSVLDDFCSIIKENFKGDINFIGHSTGCSVIFDYLHHNRYETSRFGKVVFVSPLVRSYMYKLSKVGVFISKIFISNISRNFSKGPSGDPDYCRFIELEDPLQARKIPLGWLNAMFNWNKRVKSFTKIDKSVLIFQGESDTVVDYEYNINFFKEKVSKVDVVYFKKGKHHLLNETSDIKEKIISEISTYLDLKKGI
ncbi:MAG: alpha/beta hydrolase [Deltaproteobacteria bacterium]|nr:alpha/beta hydrolase [Deltaproteobacteria bacterium]